MSDDRATVRPLFLFSLPRSGSTLLQRVLASHTAVSTAPEPWFLLPLLYSLRRDGVYAEYGHKVSTRAIEHLASSLPNGRADYLDAVRGFALDVYGRAAAPGATYFLDKTPRYSLVARDILEAFPDAACIVLWRNPLAVVASIVNTWLDGRWKPHHHRADLYAGLTELCDAYAQHRERLIPIRYEDFVSDPTSAVRRLETALGLEHQRDLTQRFDELDLAGPVGDAHGVVRSSRIETSSLQRWRQTVSSPVRKRWCRSYLQWIGRERLALMGYDLDELSAQLEAAQGVSTIAADLVDGAKGVLWSWGELDILRDKMTRRRTGNDVFSHS